MVSSLATTLTLSKRPVSFLLLYRETNAGSQLIHRRSLVTDWITLAKKPWFRIFYVGTEPSRRVSHVQPHQAPRNKERNIPQPPQTPPPPQTKTGHNHIDINMQYLPAYWFLSFRFCRSIIIWDR